MQGIIVESLLQKLCIGHREKNMLCIYLMVLYPTPLLPVFPVADLFLA